jgi:NTE family protein
VQPTLSPVTWGLALGGGGPVGFAWEVGVLRALADEAGLDPASADVIIGTSAGSMLGTWLRSGRSLEDLEGMVRSGSRLPGRALPLRDDADRRLYAEALRLWARPAIMSAEQAAAVGSVSARVDRDDPARLASFEEEFGEAWPAGRLLITSCRVADGARWNWSSASGVPLHLAVAASCTVPGQSKPLRIGDHAYLDGGVWSSTNADLLAGEGVADVIALSPMAGAMGLGRAQTARLEAEAAALGALGIETVAVHPGDAFKAEKIDLLDASHALEAMETGRAAGSKVAQHPVIGRIAGPRRVTNSD